MALAIVWGLSWLLNRMMPDTLTYERVSQVAPILEDVYTSNVSSFKKRLVRESNIETVTAIYFIVTTIVIALAIFKAGVNDWIALVIFGFFTYGAISRSISLIRVKAILKSNPTSEQCRHTSSIMLRITMRVMVFHTKICSLRNQNTTKHSKFFR